MAEREESGPDSSSVEVRAKDDPADEIAADRESNSAEVELNLELVEDGLKAVVPAVYPTTTAEEVLDLLKSHDISGKYYTPLSRTAVDVARETNQVMRDVVVAEGRPPKPAVPRIEYRPPKSLEQFPALDSIKQLLSCEDRDEVIRTAPEHRGWLVKAGQTLAILSFPDWAEGVDVRGQPIPPLQAAPDSSDSTDRALPGSGIQVSRDGLSWVAESYGYAGVLDDQVCVLSPIWLSGDEMEACFVRIHLIAGSVIPSSQRLHDLLKTSDVTFGIEDAALEAFTEAQKQQGTAPEPLYTLARGMLEVPSRTPRPSFTIEESSGAGSLRHDGSMDFKERDLFPSVEPNTLLAECETAVPGVPGQTVRGTEIPVAPPVMVLLVAGDSARAETENGIQRVFADGEGGVTVETEELRDDDGKRTIQHTVSVRSLLEIPGDVNYETGHVDFNGNVTVAGSVEGSFHVKASGDVVIEGSVEAGAEIIAGGSVTVGQGIVGSETSVKAEAALMAKFAQDAHLEARGDVTIDSYLHGASVVAGGQVQVEGSGGGIVGGETWGLKGIRALNVGSEGSAGTKLFAGLEPSQLPHLQEIRTAIRTAEDMLARLLATSGLQSFDEEEVNKLSGHSESRQEAVRQVVDEAKQHSENREMRLREEKELVEHIAEVAKLATIDVPENAYSRCHVQIGPNHLVLAQDERHVRFRAGAEDDIVSSDLG